MTGAFANRRFRVGAAGTVLVFIAIQFVPVDRTNPTEGSPVDAPDAVIRVLERACYDCHSNRTVWPWYSHVAPISWFVAHHVEDGRADLNFSDWPAFDFEGQALAFEDISHQVETGEMPLPSYLWLHGDARLTDDDRRLLLDWAAEMTIEETP